MITIHLTWFFPIPKQCLKCCHSRIVEEGCSCFLGVERDAKLPCNKFEEKAFSNIHRNIDLFEEEKHETRN